MVKGKGNIFGKKDEKDINEKKLHQEATYTEPMTAEHEKMSAPGQDSAEEINAEQSLQEPPDKYEEIQTQLKETQDKYIRLMAEFDNFRKRSLKERTDLIKSAGEDILINILPVMDDFERGLVAMDKSQDVEAVKQGVLLIYNKFKEFIMQRGVKEIESFNQDFNVDVHEAITKIPAPNESLKGKVVDVIQKGYSLNDKVIRYAKVVVGE
jgi:molecular chaperone GrpE